MGNRLESVLDYGLAEAAELLNRGFADYFVRIDFSMGVLLHAVAQDGVDMASSRVVLREGQGVGIALVARRGWSSRLAGMAMVPEARGEGVGTWLMQQLVEESKARGERSMVLEVIEENVPGVHLYKGCGFRVVRRLLSYAGTGFAGEAAELEEVDVREVARMVTAYGLADLPWQVSGESLVKLGPPSRAYRMGAAAVAISDPLAPKVGIRAVVVEPEAKRQGEATRLLRALMGTHGGKDWVVPALCPEEFGGLFEKVGLEKGDLSQLQMVREWG